MRTARSTFLDKACDPRHGFTLVELLVVVAIIALLVAILLPSLAKAREQAKRAQCASNQNQIAKAWHMYLDAHNGRFLRGVNANYNYGGRQGADPAYGGNPASPVPKPLNTQMNLPPVLSHHGEAYHCPADKGGGTAAIAFFEYYGTSYPTNQLLVGQDRFLVTSAFGGCALLFGTNFNLPGKNRLPGLTLSQVGNPGKLILMGDGGWENVWHPGLSQRIEWHRTPRTYNIAFMDTHVEFVRIRKGMHVTPEYTVIPFQDLHDDACRCQQ